MKVWWLVAALYFIAAGVSLAHGQPLLALSLVCASTAAMHASQPAKDNQMTGVLAYCARGYHTMCGGNRCECPCHQRGDADD